MGIPERFNVVESGVPDGQPMVFAHGFGCDQTMWRRSLRRPRDRFRVVLFDHAGSRANPGEYDADRHASLDGYTEDVLAILDGLDLHDVIFVGHSVSAMIGVLAAKQDPGRFAQLVLVGPSPRYINDDGYVGGFDRQDIDELLANLEANYLGWSSAMAPVIMGNLDRPTLGEELTASFCATDPRIARQFAEVTFTSDNRADLPGVNVPVLVLQCAEDAIAPVSVGEYVASQMPDASLVLLDATGHCPHLSAPEATIDAINGFVGTAAEVAPCARGSGLRITVPQCTLRVPRDRRGRRHPPGERDDPRLARVRRRGARWSEVRRPPHRRGTDLSRDPLPTDASDSR